MIVSYVSAKVSKPITGITRKILAHSSKLMLVEHSMEGGSVIPEHKHPHEQLTYLISGQIELEVEDNKFKVVEGDSFVLQGNIPHKVTALENSVAFDIFTPSREDYL